MTTLRLASWNCADGLGAKRGLLDRLEADLLMVAEVRKRDFAAIAPGYAQAFYQPSSSSRGLACFSHLPGLTQRKFRPPGGAECYLWLQLAGLDLLGAWVKPQGSYVRPASTTIAHFLRNSRAKARIVLGDLNLNPGFDRNPATGASTALVAALAQKGLRSLYHQATGEPMGAETRPTHLFTYNAARPFHIDFIFASRHLTLDHFQIGAAGDWIGKGKGDHLPLVAHLRWPPVLQDHAARQD